MMEELFTVPFAHFLPEVEVIISPQYLLVKESVFCLINFGSYESCTWKSKSIRAGNVTDAHTFQVDNLLGAEKAPWQCNIKILSKKLGGTEILGSGSVDVICDLQLKKGETASKTLSFSQGDFALKFRAMTDLIFPDLYPSHKGANTLTDRVVNVKNCPEVSITVYQAVGLTFDNLPSLSCQVFLKTYVQKSEKKWKSVTKHVLKTCSIEKSRCAFWNISGKFSLSTQKDLLQIQFNPGIEGCCVCNLDFEVSQIVSLATYVVTNKWFSLRDTSGLHRGYIALGFMATSLMDVVTDLPEVSVTDSSRGD
eukprot:TRINITY_DN8661_c1_g1_i4.p1 TRINITY_DN8661_c1_g1~~TRINITY_DN8661_c1_g1_i4.p1  ORF type:complete len:322 (-),score=63.15 TRINITY_DN8661_c1_g1_i4:251-1177(-)